MTGLPFKSVRGALLAGCAVVAFAPQFAAAQAHTVVFDIPAQDLDGALTRFGQQSEREIIISAELTRNRRAPAVRGQLTPEEALKALLGDTNLAYRISPAGSIIVEAAQAPQSASAGGDVDALIVTAQKREENIQDVPIAISAFTQEDLTTRQVAGGPDLITQVPNMTFTKTNFSSYSIQIRGIGTQAISAMTDPAVAVAFNNTPFIRNRFFEQEFYDLERVEVLRGPQGTLYGRNATAGVVNIISAKPKMRYEAKASGDISNYNSSRIEGMVNIPLVEDAVAVRLAGAWTKRDGYATNEITGNPIDGRDLWSTRLSLRFAPTDALDVNLIWEHFEEDDDRLRSGKQTCKKHVVTRVGNRDVAYTDKFGGGANGEYIQEGLSQGCERNSLYDSQSFQTPNGFAVPFYYPLSRIGLPRNRITQDFDPYLSVVQSPDLRVIESTVDPEYRARADLFELQATLELSDSLALTSETSYNSDFIFSMQDFNRFNTAPDAWENELTNSYYRENVINDGVFCDPQIGCSDRLVGIDLSTAKSRQFSQEFRLSSDFDGPLNFSLGANFLRYDTEDKYYVFVNALSMHAAISPYDRKSSDMLSPYAPGVTDNSECLTQGRLPPPTDSVQKVTSCIYMDPNSIHNLNDMGHNYFLSKNPFKLISYAAFGEVYYELADNLKITGGLRWTVDKKEAPISPSWVLASQTVGYPVAEVIEQEWREPTGRVALDWKPELGFTDDTMIYASYAHGYKAGGANPPRPGLAIYSALPGEIEATQRKSATHPRTFEPEFIDSFEIGAKNVLLDGKLTANIAAFYYDYEGYQISEIVNRSALNRNFDATIWGVELESDWRPLENLRLGFKGGYQKTRLADGSQAIDLMDRTAGNPGWVVRRPFPTSPANCILPVYTIVGKPPIANLAPPLISHGNPSGGRSGGCEIAYVLGYDPVTNLPYVPNPTLQGASGKLRYFDNYPGFNPLDESLGHNGGEGFFKDLSGNDLPNAPNYTATATVDYTLPLGDDWLATLHADYHWQSESWWRVFNDHEYNRLKSFSTVNLAAIFTNEDAGWHVMAYVKNATDETAITGAFLNSDDTMLTTNVFLTEPRLYGLRVSKAWTGGPLLGSFGERRDPSRPFPFTVELGGQVQWHDAPNDPLRPSFASAFSPTLDVFNQPQVQDLDTGDGRSARLAWRPGGGPWSASASVRYGKTNSGGRIHVQEETEGVCGLEANAPNCAVYAALQPGDPGYIAWKKAIGSASGTNWADAWATTREEHQFIDFSVGRDIEIGGLGKSTFQLGLRYGQVGSRTLADADGVPNWDVHEGWYTMVPVTHDRMTSTIEADREFEGAGPEASWAASYPLIGNEQVGRLDLAWSIGGGVMFGTQTTSLSWTENVGHYEVMGFAFPYKQVVAPVSVEPTVRSGASRRTSATVPVLDLSLGLSYDIDRMSIGAGYRWERYFDVLDGGQDSRDTKDRTIDGPYFKIAVGFGG